MTNSHHWSKVWTTAQLLPLLTWVPVIATLMSPITALTLIANQVPFPRLNDEPTLSYRWNIIAVILNHYVDNPGHASSCIPLLRQITLT